MNWLRPLGDTGMMVSALGLGTVKLGRDQGVKSPSSFSTPDDRTASALLALARPGESFALQPEGSLRARRSEPLLTALARAGAGT